MKKMNLFLGLGALALILLSSCDGLTGGSPTITINNSDPIELAVGVESVNITGSVTAENGLKEVKIYKTVDLSESLLNTYDNIANSPFTSSDSINYTFDFTLSGITQDMTLTIEVIDNEDKTSSASVDIEVAEIAGYDIVLMGAQNNADYGSTASLVTGQVYKISGDEAKNNSANIDVVYYFGAKNAALYSPSQEDIQATSFNITSWSVINSTLFTASTMSTSTFDAVTTVAEIESAGTPSLDVIPELAVGDVVAFVTDDGKKGILKVSALEATASGTITLSVKVER